ncbi:MAG: hypothetical protein ABI836_02385 [Gemmatimonadota bacterium]
MSRIPVRYLPWMLRDMLLAQGVVLFATSIVVWLIIIRISPVPPASNGLVIVRSIVQQAGWPFILYCSSGIVSTDRLQGYYRSIFSRPVSPPWYYLQRWLVGAFIVALVVPVVTMFLVFALGSFPLSWTMMGQLELTYFLAGGLTFLVSTTWRADWLIALLVLVLQSILAGFSAAPAAMQMHLSPFWDFIFRILPPFHLVSVNAQPLTGPHLAHVLLYGAGLVLAALALLRWRPLGAGGRS